MLEFLVAIVPILILMLGLVQLALLWATSTVVRHAAVTGARAAAVVLDDDPARYDGEARNCVQAQGGQNPAQGLARISSWLSFGQGGQSTGGGQGAQGGQGGLAPRSTGARYGAIYRASMLPLLSVAPAPTWLWNRRTVRQALGNHSTLGRLVGGVLYNLAAAAVTLPVEPNSPHSRHSFGPHEPVTVRVTYLYPCLVPLVSRFMCDSLLELASPQIAAAMRTARTVLGQGGTSPEQLRQAHSTLQAAMANQSSLRQSDGAQAVQALSHAPLADLQLLGLLSGTRYRVMQAEATFMNQGADYAYASENAAGYVARTCNAAAGQNPGSVAALETR